MRSFQLFVIKHKQSIKYLFHLVWAILIGILVGGFLFSIIWQDKIFLLYNLGKKFGQIALIFYLVSLLPGILKRSGWLLPIQTSLMLFRRHLGVVMFLAAFVHFSFVSLFSTLILGAPLLTQLKFIFGLTALALAFPLWLTANDASQRFMGASWRWLHRTTYLIMLFLFGHVALQQKNWAYLVGLVILLELYSWVRVWLKPKVKKSAPTQVTPAQQVASPQEVTNGS